MYDFNLSSCGPHKTARSLSAELKWHPTPLTGVCAGVEAEAPGSQPGGCLSVPVVTALAEIFSMIVLAASSGIVVSNLTTGGATTQYVTLIMSPFFTLLLFNKFSVQPFRMYVLFSLYLIVLSHPSSHLPSTSA